VRKCIQPIKSPWHLSPEKSKSRWHVLAPPCGYICMQYLKTFWNCLWLKCSAEYIWSDTERRRFYTLSSYCASGSETAELTRHCRWMCQTGRLRPGSSLWLLHGSYFCGNYIDSLAEMQSNYNIELIYIFLSLLLYRLLVVMSFIYLLRALLYFNSIFILLARFFVWHCHLVQQVSNPRMQCSLAAMKEEITWRYIRLADRVHEFSTACGVVNVKEIMYWQMAMSVED